MKNFFNKNINLSFYSSFGSGRGDYGDIMEGEYVKENGWFLSGMLFL